MATCVDVVVIGGGAAGLMAAMEAGRRGRRVVVLEHGPEVGRKILISGGGRCNFTNVGARAENYLSENPHFAKSALARYPPREFVALVEKHGIAYHEKTLGQLFCDGSARQIVTMLLKECGEAGVEVRCGVSVAGVRVSGARAVARVRESGPGAPGVVAGDAGVLRRVAPQDDGGVGEVARVRESGPGAPDGGRLVVATGVGEFLCASVVVACGGLSIPKMGATGFGYEVARSFGHTIVEPRPGLVPLVFHEEERERWCDLSGVSTEVVAQAGAGKKRGEKTPAFREKMLVTHRGLSGPAVLQASSYWRPGGEVRFDLAPGRGVLLPLLEKNARRDAAAMFFALRTVLPQRLAERWVRNADPRDWTNAGIARLEAELHAWTVKPAGTEGFAKAEVTAGGVDTRELDARTMESRRVEGLYFVGEVVDVTGWLGGYNFQWAWASGVSAGRSC